MKQSLVLLFLCLLLSVPLYAQQGRLNISANRLVDDKLTQSIPDVDAVYTPSFSLPNTLVDAQRRGFNDIWGMPIYNPRDIDSKIQIVDPSEQFIFNMPNAYTELKWEWKQKRK